MITIEDGARIEIAPGADLSADPATWPWVDITGLWRKRQPIVLTAGRRDEGKSASPASCTITFDGRGGELWSRNPLGPWFGKLGVDTPLRVQWTDPTPVDRFSGLISKLPPLRDQSGNDSTVTIRADGVVSSRLQGEKQLQSALFRSLASHPKIMAYWPMEDGQDASAFASPIAGVGPMSFSGNVDFAQEDVPAGSRDLPLFKLGSGHIGNIPPTFTGTADQFLVFALFRVDQPLPPTTQAALHVNIAGNEGISNARILFTDSQFIINVRRYDIETGFETLALVGEPIHSDFQGQWLWLRMSIFLGSVASFRASAFSADTDEKLNDILAQVSGAPSGGRPSQLYAHNISSVEARWGHMTVFDGILGTEDRAPFEGGVTSGYNRELAADRFERLCDEENLPCRIVHEPTPPSGGMALVRRSDEDAAVTFDNVNLDIVGDTDLRLEFDLPQEINFISGTPVRGLARKAVPTGDQRSWLLRMNDDRTIRFRWSSDGVTFNPEAISTEPILDGRVAIKIELDTDNGAGGHTVSFYVAERIDRHWSLLGAPFVGSGTTSVFASTAPVEVGRTLGGTGGGFSGNPVGRFYAFELRNGIGGTEVANPVLTDQAVGTTAFTDDAGRPWTLEGEAAIVRPDTTTPMGPQRSETLIGLFREVETADGGILDGLVYRTRRSLYNQDPPPLRLSIPDGDLAQPPAPTDDDQRLRRDVTVERIGGSSARLIVPPGGRSESIRANLATDGLPRLLAGHRLVLGTVDEYRFPRIGVALHKQQHLIPEWLATRVGDRLTVDHDIPQLPGTPIDVIVEGWTERIGHSTWDVQMSCAPASPYHAAVYGQARYDTENTVLFREHEVGIDSSLTVTVPPLWTTDDEPFDIAVAGVVLRVTAVGGVFMGRQSMNVTPVNGVFKTIPVGEKVTLARRSRYAF